MPRIKTFGPYRQTPEVTIKQLEDGVDIWPSYIDAIPLTNQFEYEEIRGNIIKRKMRKHEEDIKRKKEYRWSEKG